MTADPPEHLPSQRDVRILGEEHYDIANVRITGCVVRSVKDLLGRSTFTNVYSHSNAL